MPLFFVISEKLNEKTILVKRAASETVIFKEIFCRDSSTYDFLKLLFCRFAFFYIHAKEKNLIEISIQNFERIKLGTNHLSDFESIIKH